MKVMAYVLIGVIVMWYVKAEILMKPVAIDD